MKMCTLQELFVDQLRDIYDAEKQLIKALPKMAKAAHSSALRAGFEEHLEQTRHQAKRLEQVFEKLGERARAKKCEAMKGLIEEGEELLDTNAESDVMDAGLICAAQKVEHYEIAAYGTLCTWAQQLGKHECCDLLKQTLDEEKATDEKLTHLAESGINQAATVGANA
jgi:ferritin-like metal-binding protein YciE